MLRLRFQMNLAAVIVASALVAFIPLRVEAAPPVVNVNGGGTAAFDEGEELEGFTTQFSVGAHLSDEPVENLCDDALDGLGVGDFTVTDGNDFVAASGYFNCSLNIQGEGGGFLIILGNVLQGRVNDDDSITLCGLADIPIDTFSGQTFIDCPFAVTFRTDESGFTYFDVVTGPAGDAETLVNGNVSIR